MYDKVTLRNMILENFYKLLLIHIICIRPYAWFKRNKFLFLHNRRYTRPSRKKYCAKLFFKVALTFRKIKISLLFWIVLCLVAIFLYYDIANSTSSKKTISLFQRVMGYTYLPPVPISKTYPVTFLSLPSPSNSKFHSVS